MIDWLNIEVPFAHRPIAQGRRLVIDHDGTITSDFVQLRAVEKEHEGSYSTRIAVSSIDTDYTVGECGVLDAGSGLVSGLSVKGNPIKYLQGHNIFGPSCIKTLARAVVADVLPKLGFSTFDVARCLVAIEEGRYRVTKIDITKMFRLGSDADVDAYLQMMRHTVSARGDRCEFCKNTFYVGKHSGLWSFKFYNKLREISSRAKAHRLPDFLPRDAFFEFTTGLLRAELVLHAQILNRLNLTDPQKLQNQLDALFNEFAGRLTMKNQAITDVDILKLSRAYQATLAMWREGRSLKSELPRETYYRHRRKFLELGIDIGKRPIRVEDKIAEILPLKVLAPQEVTEIPVELQPYLLKVA